MASQDLLTSRKSRQNMNERICSLSLTLDMHSSLISAAFFTGEGTHSLQSGYVQPSPTTAPHRSSDLSTFPHILDSQEPPTSPFLCHLPRTSSSFSWSGWNRTKLGQYLEIKCHSNLGSSYCCKPSYGSILGPFYLQNRCSYI